MNVLQTQFHNIPLSIIDHNGKHWLTAEQAGICLGYAKDHARTSIQKLYARHAEEFSNVDSTVVNLTTVDDKNRDVRIFSDTGCIKLGFFANTKASKDFRQFASHQLAGQSPLPVTQADAPHVVDARLDRLEQAVVGMAVNMSKLVDVSTQQAEKLDVTARYIGLLEINQKGKVKITRTIEAQVLALRAQGMAQADISRQLRISAAAVNLLVHGKYNFAAYESALPKASIESILEAIIDDERDALIKKLGGQ